MNHPSRKFRSTKRNSLQVTGPRKALYDFENTNLLMSQNIHQLNNTRTPDISQTQSITLASRRQSEKKQKIRKSWRNQQNSSEQLNHLRTQLLKNSDILRSKNLKLDDALNKLSEAQKQIEVTRGLVNRNEILKRNNETLDRKITKLQKSLQDRIKADQAKADEIEKLKGMLSIIKGQLSLQDDTKAKVMEKNREITFLSQKCKHLDQKVHGEFRTATNTLEANKTLQDQNEQLKRRLRVNQQIFGQINKQKQNLRRQLLQSEFTVKRLLHVENALAKQQILLKQANIQLSKYHELEQDRSQQQSIKYKSIKRQLQQKVEFLLKNNEELKRKHIKNQVMIYEYQEQLDFLTKKIDRADYIFCQVLELLKCLSCKRIAKQAVTLVPCGHSVCLGCSKGVFSFCSQCGPTVEIQKYHRNQILDAMNLLLQNHDQMIDKIRVKPS